MCDSDMMKKYLKSFDEEDINYIGELNFKIINMVYFEKKRPPQIACELQLEESEVHFRLDYGYEKMMGLSKKKYIFNKLWLLN